MLLPMLNVLYIYISTFRSVCVVPSVAVFCRSLMSCFPGMLFRYFVNDFVMIRVRTAFTVITSVFKFHIIIVIIIIICYYLYARYLQIYT